MRSIFVSFIPHSEQAYDTLDNYHIAEGITEFKISDTGDARSNMALLIHALVEQFEAECAGVSIEAIDKWDMEHLDEPGEPGDIPGCPYFVAHAKAMLMEQGFCETTGLPWADHEVNLENCGKIIPITVNPNGGTGYV